MTLFTATKAFPCTMLQKIMRNNYIINYNINYNNNQLYYCYFYNCYSNYIFLKRYHTALNNNNNNNNDNNNNNNNHNNNNNNSNNRSVYHIAIGLSGGVDSATAAYLLQQQGHKITAIFMNNWDPNNNSISHNVKNSDDDYNNNCCEHLRDARKVST